LEIIDCAGEIPQLVIGYADVSQGKSQAPLVAASAPDRQRALVIIERQLLFIQRPVNLCDRVERERFLAAVAFFLDDAQGLLRRLQRRSIISKTVIRVGFVRYRACLIQTSAEFAINRDQRVNTFNFSFRIAQIMQRFTNAALRSRLAAPITE